MINRLVPLCDSRRPWSLPSSRACRGGSYRGWRPARQQQAVYEWQREGQRSMHAAALAAEGVSKGVRRNLRERA
jgi:hypothetical protein